MAAEGADPFGLRLQHLRTDSDRVLVLAQLAGLRNGTNRFATAELSELFDSLRVPPPANISARLGDLRSRGLAIRVGTRWALTPEGEVATRTAIGELDTSAIDIELAAYPGAEFGHVRHSVISPAQAPQKWVQPIARLLADFAFERNVFLMTRFPTEGDTDSHLDPIGDVIETVRTALGGHGLMLHLASDRQLDDDLLGNVAAHMWACQYGLGLLEDRAGRGLNYNVVIEIGAMIMTGRRCGLIRDSATTPGMPTDLVGQIYKSVDFGDASAVSRLTHRWAALDLQLGACRRCPQIESD